ncbi:sulfite exporter TauE/SafE family protein [Marinobacter daepoensis]|uniref:Probable membrane transporter protein n=1 Tax=Marinobacter daepoensis TaxID=262077 RepID=A0ABS3BIA4_9GAMM|nr:sulfite exporter TauE/SafE family protein [Marinobacter daepoensis]MBN7771574.1 sulfite exporter TauE/SafE family protein [Marinobacter daepoensis]MBY6034159.1 sulfite exporter TauE/SafE family protein [Marinobacter daepoensis]MBY6080174.1 sulfite exporter TauE/SafE family protein [Marinobacter daepoensis]
MSMIGIIILYLLLGALAGTMAGLFGIGGGLVIVPVLIFSFGLQGISPEIAAHLAVGTSLATIVFTSISSIRTHHQHGAVRWDLFRPMTVGIVVGAVLGAWTAALLSGPVLETIIGVFVILVALKMILEVNPKAGRSVPGKTGLGAAGGVIGWASAIFGIGGGTLTVPYLSWCNVRMQQAVATSAACGFPIAIAGALANIWTGWQNPDLPELSLGFIYLPALIGVVATSVFFARIGARLAHRLDGRLLKRIFAIVLVLVGLRFLLS